MPSEPNLSKELISNSTVCWWFYIFAIYNGLVAVAAILMAIFMSSNKDMRSLTPIVLFGAVGAFVNAWFLFLMCNRGINDGFKDKKTHMYY